MPHGSVRECMQQQPDEETPILGESRNGHNDTTNVSNYSFNNNMSYSRNGREYENGGRNFMFETYTSFQDEEEVDTEENNTSKKKNDKKKFDNGGCINGDHDDICDKLSMFVKSIPATILVSVLNLMLAVPFGSAYFSPVIPLGETQREALGIRLSLLALVVGQGVYGGGASALDPATMWQLGELSPFYHTLADIAASSSMGDEESIFPTTMYLLSLSTLTLGLTFYLLGRFGLGQLTYFFPTHVLLGLVGGLGVWLAILAVSISISPSVAPTRPPVMSFLTIQFLVSVFFASILRILRYFIPKEKCLLLDPIYFLSIPLVFYGALRVFGIDVEDAVDAGYFFAEPDAASAAAEDVVSMSAWAEATEIWTMFDMSKVRWESAIPAMSTLLTSALMGVLITAPFIPATAVLLKKDNFDFNREFVAHGYANAMSALVAPGGLGVSLTYSVTVVYKNAGGKGKMASFLISILTLGCFVYGPRYVEYIPRCMAGSLVFDLGINLFLEAVIEPAKKCDFLEYSAIWIIIIVMNVFNMTAGLVAGLLAAVFTYTLQSFIEKDPVRTICDGSSVPSSKWRNAASLQILKDPHKGRARIGIVQLQGHIFFGNLSKVERKIFDFLTERKQTGQDIRMVILDFTLVLGIDVTAASFFENMRRRIQKQYDAATVMVSGPLNQESIQREQTSSSSLSYHHHHQSRRDTIHYSTPPSQVFGGRSSTDPDNGERESTIDRRVSTTNRGPYETLERKATINGKFYETLDEALISCEDNLVGRYDMASLLLSGNSLPALEFGEEDDDVNDEIVDMLSDKFEGGNRDVLLDLVKYCRRETRAKGDVLWNYGDEGTTANILLSGELSSVTDRDGVGDGGDDTTNNNKRHCRIIEAGEIVGLRCLILKERHLATVRCKEKCILYTLDQTTYDRLVDENPRVAHLLMEFLAHDLSRRLQHVSNKIYISRSVLT